MHQSSSLDSHLQAVTTVTSNHSLDARRETPDTMFYIPSHSGMGCKGVVRARHAWSQVYGLGGPEWRVVRA